MAPIIDSESPRALLALLLQQFSELDDNREAWRVVYPIEEVLLLVTCATIAGMTLGAFPALKATLFAMSGGSGALGASVCGEPYFSHPVRITLSASARSSAALAARSDASPAGSTSTFSKRCSAGSMGIRRRCGSDAKPSSIPSAQSKLGWVLPTS
jgi:hypothetical protein